MPPKLKIKIKPDPARLAALRASYAPKPKSATTTAPRPVAPPAPSAPVTYAPTKVNQRSDTTKALSLTRARGHFLPKFIQAPRRRRIGEPRTAPARKPTTTKTGRPKRKATAKQLASLAKARASRAAAHIPRR